MADMACRRMPLRPEKSHFPWSKPCLDRMSATSRVGSGRRETRLLGWMLGASGRTDAPATPRPTVSHAAARPMLERAPLGLSTRHVRFVGEFARAAVRRCVYPVAMVATRASGIATCKAFAAIRIPGPRRSPNSSTRYPIADRVGSPAIWCPQSCANVSATSAGTLYPQFRTGVAGPTSRNDQAVP